MKRISAALRVAGDSLEPAHITRLLGCEPTFSARKGQIVNRGKKFKPRPWPTGIWMLNSQLDVTKAPELHFEMLLNAVTSDPQIWKQIRAEYEIDIYSIIYHGNEQCGFSLSLRTMQMLIERGIALEFDLGR